MLLAVSSNASVIRPYLNHLLNCSCFYVHVIGDYYFKIPISNNSDKKWTIPDEEEVTTSDGCVRRRAVFNDTVEEDDDEEMESDDSGMEEDEEDETNEKETRQKNFNEMVILVSSYCLIL